MHIKTHQHRQQSHAEQSQHNPFDLAQQLIGAIGHGRGFENFGFAAHEKYLYAVK